MNINEEKSYEQLWPDLDNALLIPLLEKVFSIQLTDKNAFSLTSNE